MPIALLRLETRRSVGVWLLLAIPVAVWWVVSQDVVQRAAYWFETSIAVRNALIIFGPLVAGAAAWIAGREHRRGLADLLTTTPYPHSARLLASWIGTIIWCIFGYLIVGAGVITLSLLKATWGGPFVGPILVSLIAIPTYAALGFALGYHFPNRFTTPLVVVALLFGQVIIGELAGWYAFLSPMAYLNPSVWYGVQPNLAPQQTFFLLSLGGLALASLTLRAHPGRLVPIICIALTLTTVASVALLWRDAPVMGGHNLSADPRYRFLTPIPYQPVCREATILICVHPAYAAQLGEATATIDRLIAPILGLPGLPTRAEQGYRSIQGTPTEPTLWFDIYPHADFNSVAFVITNNIIRDDTLHPTQVTENCQGTDSSSCVYAQYAIGRWLMQQADVPDPRMVYVRAADGSDPTKAAAERFAALDPAQQRAWLVAHFADLRVGKVRLEDLP